MRLFTTDRNVVVLVAIVVMIILANVCIAQTEWVKHYANPVLDVGPDEWDDQYVSNPVVIHDGTVYKMWYDGHGGAGDLRIGYATSPDGINWDKYSDNPVLDLGSPGEWDSLNLGSPTVLFDDTISIYRMWYYGFDGHMRIGYATSPDGINWTKYDKNGDGKSDPVLDLGNWGTWDDTDVWTPTVLLNGTEYQMWYSGSDGSSGHRIGYATSLDGVNWVKHPNPVLWGTEAWEGSWVFSPIVIFNGNEYEMWYSGMDGSHVRIGYATSIDGINWVKHPNNPVLNIGTSGTWEEHYVHHPTVISEGTTYKMWYGGTTHDWIGRIGYAVSSPISAIITVDDDLVDFPSADFTKIQDAVNVAGLGDTIRVYPGTYTENVDINKENLTIQSVSGADVTVVQAATSDDVFEVTASYVTIEGFAIKDAIRISVGRQKAGIYLNTVDHCRIEHNIFTDNDNGIYMAFRSNSNTISDNLVSGSYQGIELGGDNNSLVNNVISDNGLGIEGGGTGNNIDNNTLSNNSVGLHLCSAPDSLVTNNNIVNNYDGIWIHSWCSGTLAGNTVSGSSRHNFDISGVDLNIDTSNTINGKPIYYFVGVEDSVIDSSLGEVGYLGIVNSTNIVVRDLILDQKNGQGLLLSNCAGLEIENIQVSNGFDGVYIAQCSDSHIANCAISNCTTGIRLLNSTSNGLISNLISNSSYGVTIHKSDGNTISGNNISAYSIAIRFSGGNANNIVSENAILKTYTALQIDIFPPYVSTTEDNIIYLNNFTNFSNAVYWSFPPGISRADYPDQIFVIWHSPDSVTYSYNGNMSMSYLGNYWDSYSGSDANGDGIGDTPHSMDGDQDDYPLMMPFENYVISSVISAIIDSYYPNDPNNPIQVGVGQSVPISVTFTNTGNTVWQFIAGASVWDSNGVKVADYEETLASPLQPGQQTTVEWSHTVDQPGYYWLQFGVWKAKPYIEENLLDRKPSPSQRLIVGMPPSQPRTIYVDDDNIIGPWDGTQDYPYQYIQDGIDAALDSDTVFVLDGTYTGDRNKNLDFYGKAITVKSKNGRDYTIIDCENDGRGFNFHSGETLESVVDGFTIRNGNANGGGAIACGDRWGKSSPTIINNIIEGCSGDAGGGGGIHCTLGSSPLLKNNIIRYNFTSAAGGAIYCTHQASPDMKNNIITDNRADRFGGGIVCAASSTSVLANNIIARNTAGEHAGAIYFDRYSTVTLVNNTITQNNASYGSGLYCHNITSLTIVNTILWNNGQDELSGYTSVIDITYSDIQGGWTGEGNINADPVFIDADSGNYHLDHESPCIDAGTQNGTPAEDIDGNPRDTIPDIGAFEGSSDTGFRPKPNGYQFSNYTVEDVQQVWISWEIFRDTYGVEETEVNGVPRRSAWEFWSNFREDGGFCYGMAATSLLLYQRAHNTWDLGDDRLALLDNHRDWGIFEGYMNTIHDFIASYQIRQDSESVERATEIAYDNQDDILATYQRIRARMAGDWQQDPYILNFARHAEVTDNQGNTRFAWIGHSVVPYKIAEAADHTSAKVYIYDSNKPYRLWWEVVPPFDQDRNYIEFDLVNNRWRYEQSLNYSDWQDGDADDDEEPDHAIATIPMSAVLAEPDIPERYIGARGSGHLLIVDSQERELGYRGELWRNEIPNSEPVIPLVDMDSNEPPGNSNFPEAYILADDLSSYTTMIMGTGIGNIDVNMFGRNSLIQLIDITTTKSTQDQIGISLDGDTLNYSTNDPTKLYSVSIVKELGNSSRVFTISNTSLLAGEESIFRINDEKTTIEYINPGIEKTYNLRLEEVGFHPGLFLAEGLVIGFNERHLIQVDDWTQIGNTQILLLVDEENDGTIEREEILGQSMQPSGSAKGAGWFVRDGNFRNSIMLNVVCEGGVIQEGSYLKYLDGKTRMFLMSSSIGSFSISDNTCTFSGDCTINRDSGYSFEATVTDANPDEISISVTGPDDFSYSCSGALVGGNIAVSTDAGGQAAPLKLPEETALLQNYPNPFNPDTWIPFNLSKDSDVTIEMYDISGRLIRKLQLGYIPAGSYVARDMAAYWDGRNEAGERAASGVYFYSIKTNDFTSTKKMTIVR